MENHFLHEILTALITNAAIFFLNKNMADKKKRSKMKKRQLINQSKVYSIRVLINLILQLFGDN